MADSKISALAAASVAAVANELVINEAGTSKKLTIAQLVTLLQQSYGLPRIKQLTGQHLIASTTATEVTGLKHTLEAGTFVFDYRLIIQSASTTIVPKYGLNFGGTSTTFNWWYQHADDSATLLAALGIASAVATTQSLGFQMASAQNVESTTAPNMGFLAGVSDAGTNIMIKISGLIIVTVAGELELWHSAETDGTNTSVEVGSSSIVIRTA